MRKSPWIALAAVLCLSFIWPASLRAQQSENIARDADARIQQLRAQLKQMEKAQAKFQAEAQRAAAVNKREQAEAAARVNEKLAQDMAAQAKEYEALARRMAGFQGQQYLGQTFQGQPLPGQATDVYGFAVQASANDASGLTTAPADRNLRDHLALGENVGVVVTAVSPNSPGAEAGFQVHDVITSADGKPVKSSEDFSKASKPNADDKDAKDAAPKTIAVEIRRAGETKTLSLVCKPKLAMTFVNIPLPPAYYIGVRISALDEAMRSQLKLGDKGIAIEEVEPKSPAEKAGLIGGDLIVEFAGKPIGSVEELVKTVADNKEKPAKIKVLHHGKEKTVEVAPTKRPAPAATTKVEGNPAEPAERLIYRPGQLQEWRTFSDMDAARAQSASNQAQVEKRLASLEKQLEKVVKSLELISEQLKKDK